MTAPELKPCPFCGSEVTTATGTTAKAIQCTGLSSCLGSGLLVGFKSDAQDTAIAAWNRRDPAVIAELPEVKAMIAAAVEGAATILGDMYAEALNASTANLASNSLSQRAAAFGIAENTMRALTPADHKAALDRMMQEARNDAMREAANSVVRVFREWEVTPAAGFDDLCCIHIPNAIRALIKESKP